MADVRVGWAAADAPAAADLLLSVPERARLARFERQIDRDRFRTAHVLLRVLVGAQAGVAPSEVVVVQACERCGEAHGRPTVTVGGRVGPPVSLSHAGRLVVAAVADAPVGVDVEPLGAVDDRVADVALSAAERLQLAALPPAERPDALTRWWVRKEAILKATGFGMGIDPADVEVSPPHAPPKLVAWRGDGRPPSVRLSDVVLGDGHAAAVAVLTRRRLRVRVAHEPLDQRHW